LAFVSTSQWLADAARAIQQRTKDELDRFDGDPFRQSATRACQLPLGSQS
jgi:hypothetical protein